MIALSFPVTARGQPVARVRHQLAQLVQLRRDYSRPLVDQGTGHLLVEDPSIAEYYLPAGNQWQRWSSTRNIVLPSERHRRSERARRESSATATRAPSPSIIQDGYFSLIALNFADTTALDQSIAADLKQQPALPHAPGRPLRH